MNDRSPRLSDEDSFNTAMADAFADAGNLHDILFQNRDPDPDAGMRDSAEDGLVPEDIRARGQEEMEATYGLTGESATARIAEEMALHGPRPIASEPDTRQVWLNGDRPLTFDDPVPPDIQAAFDQIGASIEMELEVVAPEGYQMEDEREQLIWATVHRYHTQVVRLEKRIDQVSQECNTLRKTESQRIAEQGRDPASVELETKTRELLSLSSKRDRYEQFRDYAADLYFHHTKQVWAPRRGSHVSQTGDVVPRVDGKDFARAARAGHDTRELPEGTLIAVAGGKEWTDHDRIYKHLDRCLKEHPDMVLAHGGAKGVQQIASSWARNRDVPQEAFVPQWKNHGDDRGAAIKARDDAMLRARPAKIVHFAVPDTRPPRLCTEAKKHSIPVEPVAERTRNLRTAPPHESPHRVDTAARLGQQEDAKHRLHDAKNPVPPLSAEKIAGPVEIALPGGRTGTLITADEAPALQDSQARPTLVHASQSRHQDPAVPEGTRDAKYADAVVHGPSHVAEASSPPYLAPSEEPKTVADGMRVMVDAVAPDTAENETVRTSITHRIVDVFHSMISGPGGLTDRTDDLADRQNNLHRENFGGEITLNQLSETGQELEHGHNSLDLFEQARAELAATAEELTGEKWVPRPSPDAERSQPVSAAAADAAELVERLQKEHDMARMPKGFPVAVTAYQDGADQETVDREMDRVLAHRPDMWIAHGNSHGTLELVANWADRNNVPQALFELDKGQTGASSIRARDYQIIDTVKPQGVIEFKAENSSKSTFLAEKARNDKIPVHNVVVPKEPSTQQRRDETQNRSQGESMRQTLSTGKSAGMSM
ncbi:MAG: SLOG family protein [Rhodospirillales bacterium]|nr:SLOG family protein [Rhodospirillales bacterium]